MRLEEIMTKNPATVRRGATAQEAARLMAEKDVGFVPILGDDGKLAGVITDRDLAVRVLAKGKLDMKVDEFMTKDLLTCPQDADVEDCRRQMAQRKVQRIVVVDRGQKPVGVVSLQDLARSASDDEVGGTVKQVKEDGASARH